MKKLIVVVLLALIGVGGGWLVSEYLLPHKTSLTKVLSAPGGEFTLNSASGPVSLEDFKGKVVLVYFSYTFCPDVCPISREDRGQVSY